MCDVIGLGCILRIWISSKFQDNADAAGSGTTLRTTDSELRPGLEQIKNSQMGWWGSKKAGGIRGNIYFGKKL